MLAPHPRGITLDLYVQPRAGRSEFAGLHNGALRVRIAAPPIDGAANAALLAFLADRLGVRKADVTIVSGERGRRKRVLVVGLDVEAVRERLGPAY
jgi:uncharacterized protein (TIGR00251 family)